MRVSGGIMLRPCNMVHGGANHLAAAKHCSIPQSIAQDGRLRMTCSVEELSLRSGSGSAGTSAGPFLAEKQTGIVRPRNKWMEYQGIKNWDGLLDPLDGGLRDEILRYGDFVEAAYRAFEFDTSSQGFATCRYSRDTMLNQCGMERSGYRVVKDLHATCAVQVPRWAGRVPSWVSTRSSWIGYVAVCDDESEIERLGRRDVVIAYRGTATCLEWLENLRATLSPLPGDMAPRNNRDDPMVQSGFLSLYTSRNTNFPSLQESVREEIAGILETYGDEPLSITITGHSLGAALATLTAYDVATKFKHAPLVTAISFGGPRVGNRSFRRQLERSGTKVLRIVNSDDPITKVPGFVLDKQQEEKASKDAAVQLPYGLADWLQKRMEETQTQWEYAEIGEELRLSSRDCPQLKKGGVATCHDLKTYLHLVNNLSSRCPIRATAKRVLDRAQQQKHQQLMLN